MLERWLAAPSSRAAGKHRHLAIDDSPTPHPRQAWIDIPESERRWRRRGQGCARGLAGPLYSQRFASSCSPSTFKPTLRPRRTRPRA